MKATPPSAKTQGARFIEAARALGTDESEAAFDQALRKVASAPPAPLHKTDKGKATGKGKPSTRRRK